MSGAEHLIALDLGTTSVRALVVSVDGSVSAQASRPLTTRFPRPGWLEQHPDEFWRLSTEVLREALATSGLTARDLSALGVVTQRASAVAWDPRSGEPLAPVIGWQDTRTQERAAELAANALPVPANCAALRFEWWMKHDEDVADAARSGRAAFGTPDAWLTWQLTGGKAHVTDPGQASCTVLCDGDAREWAEGLCDLFSVPQAALPTIAASSAVVGETPAALLGAPVPVASRAGDQQASAFAQAVHRAGLAKLTLGTSAMADLHCGSEPAALADGVFPLALWQLGERTPEYCREGSVFTAGAAVDWLAALGVANGAAEIEALAASVGDAGGVVFVPALQGLGSPHLDAEAAGLIGGLTRGSGRPQLARAVLDGVAQRCADVVEALGLVPDPRGAGRADFIRVDGGLARSRVLLQSFADLSGLEVRRSSEVETTALGAAFLAGLAVGLYADPADCAELVGVDACFEPRLGPERRAEARARWRTAIERVRSGSLGGR